MSDTAQPQPTGTLGVLASGAAAVARGSNLDASLGQLMDIALAAVSATRAAVLIQDPEQAELEVAVARGYEHPSAAAVIQRAGGADALKDAASRPVGSLDVPLGDAEDARLVSLLPLIAGHEGIDRTVGMLVVERAGRPLGDAEQTLLYAVADLAAAAVDRVQVRSVAVERADWFERLAAADPLTGLANRRVLGRVIEHELTRAGRQGSEVSVAVFDVDAFRDVNATAGRQVGDRVLQEVAAAISGAVRVVDTVARLGADEFVVVAPGSGGLIVARRVMDVIRRLEAVLDRTVTVSAGVVRFPAHGATADELLAAAMGALDAAKAAAPGGLVEAAAPTSA